MSIVKHRNIFFGITGAITACAIAAIIVFGLPLSIDFTGGSLVEVEYQGPRPSLPDIRASVDTLPLGAVSLRESGERGIVVRTHTLTPEERNAILGALSLQGEAPVIELRSTSIGPSLGSELAGKALYAILAVIVTIVLYIAFAFRKVSRPVSSWIYGLTVIVVLVHDVIVPLGFYAVYAHFVGAEVDSLLVVALLAILGYSVNDTIVIFDRVREHLRTNEEKSVREPFAETVDTAVIETLGRSINTSLTVVLALAALVVFGSGATVHFAAVLLAGVVAGTYSSILVAAPLLIPLSKALAKKD